MAGLPEEVMFQRSHEEFDLLRSQNATIEADEPLRTQNVTIETDEPLRLQNDTLENEKLEITDCDINFHSPPLGSGLYRKEAFLNTDERGVRKMPSKERKNLQESENELSPGQYGEFLISVKGRIRSAQVKATLSANTEMLALYWDIGRMITNKQEKEGWGVSVIPKLSRDIRNELPRIKGFSERNIKRMTQFYREYPLLAQIGPPLVAQLPMKSNNRVKGPPPVAQLSAKPILGDVLLQSPKDALDKNKEKVQQLAAKLPWGHNILLIQMVKDFPTRFWYMRQCLEQGWSRNVLKQMIKNRVHTRQGESTTNFENMLPDSQSDLAKQALKDPYIFDFLTLEKPFRERELEVGLTTHLESFLLELGAGFAFVGRQYHLDVGGDDFYIDLLFYHLKLRCYVVIDLKCGPFKPDYTGKMNFYLNVVDDKVKHEDDNPSIGMILCQDKKKIIAEYALRGISTPIGVSEYELTRALPNELKSALPTIEKIEKELSEK